MPRYLWDPAGLPEIELPEAESAPPLPERRGSVVRARLRRILQESGPAKTARKAEAPHCVAAKQAEERVSAALSAWKDAERYFDNVSDPELIGFAAYEIEAARRKYLFLLKNAHKIK